MMCKWIFCIYCDILISEKAQRGHILEENRYLY